MMWSYYAMCMDLSIMQRLYHVCSVSYQLFSIELDEYKIANFCFIEMIIFQPPVTNLR